MLLALLACRPPPAPAELPSPAQPRILALDPGAFVDGQWVGAPTDAAVDVQANGQTATNGVLLLEPGWMPLTVTRACGVVTAPVFVDAASEVVSVPYASCVATHDAPDTGASARLDRRERTRADILALQTLGILPDLVVPEGPDDLPAAWITREEAASYCAFWGARLPTEAEWRTARGDTGVPRSAGPLPTGPSGRADLDRAPSIGPRGHEDLVGNVAEWLAGSGPWGDAAGGSWLRSGEVWRVPANARSEEIGFRCAFD